MKGVDVTEPTAAQCPELDAWSLGHYVHEVEHQCWTSLVAARGLEYALQSKNPAAVFEEAQALLSAAAAVRRLLFANPPSHGPGGRALSASEDRLRTFTIQRAKRVRRELEVRGGRPVEAVAVRNALEHFDERLDTLVLAMLDGSEPRALIDGNVSRAGAIRHKGMVPHYLRHYDPTTGVLSVLGTEVDLRELVTDLASILDAARRWKS